MELPTSAESPTSSAAPSSSSSGQSAELFQAMLVANEANAGPAEHRADVRHSELPSEPSYTRISPGAFELKFVVDESIVPSLIDWAREHLDADPYTGLEQPDHYRVNGLYLDTPCFDVYYRTPAFARQKHRLRRYSTEATVWLERKKKRSNRVRKRRIAVEQQEVPTKLALGPQGNWDGDWFLTYVVEQQLRPVCTVTYNRFVRLKQVSDGYLRLTLDSELRAAAASSFSVPNTPLVGPSLLASKRILELKFPRIMPGIFRSLVQDFNLQIAPFSKYRSSVEACLAPEVLGGTGSSSRVRETG